MRWFVLIILAYLCVQAQSIARILIVVRLPLGDVVPDLLAIVAVFFALYLRQSREVVVVAWSLGLALDLAAPGGFGSPAVVGPMALTYALAAYIVFSIREVFYRERISTQVAMVVLFCLVSHLLWVTIQTILAYRPFAWGVYGTMLAQALCLTLYTAVLTPLLLPLLVRRERWWIAQAASRTGRER